MLFRIVGASDNHKLNSLATQRVFRTDVIFVNLTS